MSHIKKNRRFEPVASLNLIRNVGEKQQMRKKKQCKNESVLVIILAETREHELTFPPFKKNLLDIMNADLCLCVANNHREDTNNPFYQHAKYVWSYDEPDDWGDAFDFIQNKKCLQNDWRKLLEIKDQWLGGIKGCGEHPGSAGILLFFRIFLKESLIKHKLTEKYDRFIVTRSDFMHHVPHVPLKFLNPKYIWIPNGEDYGGYTDRHIIANSNDILTVLSIGDRILAEPLQLHDEMAFHSKWNVEKFIMFSFKNLGLEPKVRRFPYTMYSVRSPDGHTRWSKGCFSERHGYYIKYPDEYKGHQIASLLITKHEDWNKVNISIVDNLSALIKSRYAKKIKKIYVKIKKRVFEPVNHS